MNRFFTLLLAASCLTAVGQSEYCLEGTVWDEALQGCVPESVVCEVEFDYDGDGTVGSGDLLAFLTAFGASFPDEDADGVCDEIDECVGEYDECGVCNGPGAVYDCGCEECIEIADCGVVSYQGYDYMTVIIGDQCWLAENLRSENYQNGDAIPSGLSANWNSWSSGAVTVYGEDGVYCDSWSPDGDACDETWSLNEYGRLYNLAAVNDTRGLCPVGWHISTIDEWAAMIDVLGGYAAAGNKLKTSFGWYDYPGEGGVGNGTNSSGFSGLPGGAKQSDYSFNGGGSEGMWWATGLLPDGPYNSWVLALSGYDGVVQSFIGEYFNAHSIRCIKDSE